MASAGTTASLALTFAGVRAAPLATAASGHGLGRDRLQPASQPASRVSGVSQANTLRYEAAQLNAADCSVSGSTASHGGDPLTLFQVI